MKYKKIAAVILSIVMLSSFAVAGCGSRINKDAVAATLDGKEISMGIANFAAQHQAAQIDGNFLAYYGEDMWTSDSGSGSTMEESVKESLMESLQEYYLLDAHTADYGVELTDEEKTAITQAASKFLADNSKETLDLMSATQETVEEMLRLHTIQTKMHDAIIKEIDTNVTDEECAQKTFSYVRFSKPAEDASAADSSTDDTSATDTETTADDVKAEAEEFLKNAEDDMEAAAEAGEYTILTCSYGKGDLEEDENTTSMDQDVLKEADKLKKGQLASDVIEVGDDYYVIRMDSTDDKEAAKTKKESILNQRRNDKYSEVIQDYKDNCEWKINEDEWKKVNFDKLYTITTSKSDTSASDGTDTTTDGNTDTSADSSADTATDDRSDTTADQNTDTSAEN